METLDPKISKDPNYMPLIDYRRALRLYSQLHFIMSASNITENTRRTSGAPVSKNLNLKVRSTLLHHDILLGSHN